jgi:hypothetical protein
MRWTNKRDIGSTLFGDSGDLLTVGTNNNAIHIAASQRSINRPFD